MSRTFTTEAIVLATYNVGEADRFCVLFTRDRGRIAARANASRKPGSKLGGILLPQRRVRIEIREWSNGFVVTGAQALTASILQENLSHFLVRTEIAEMLLLLLHDGEAHTELFDCAAQAMERCEESASPAIVRILHLLGHFPEASEGYFEHVSAEDRCTLQQWALGKMETVCPLSPQGHLCISTLCASVLEGHGNGRRKVPAISNSLC